MGYGETREPQNRDVREDGNLAGNYATGATEARFSMKGRGRGMQTSATEKKII